MSQYDGLLSSAYYFPPSHYYYPTTKVQFSGGLVFSNPLPTRSSAMQVTVKETTKPKLTFGELKGGDVFRQPGSGVVYVKMHSPIEGKFGSKFDAIDVKSTALVIFGDTKYQVERASKSELAVEF